MRLNVCEVQPVPYEPCHGRPDSQPARPRLPQGCGSRTLSSPSEGAPPPLHILDLTHRCRQHTVGLLFVLTANQMQRKARSPVADTLKCSTLTAALVDSPWLFVKVVGVRLIKVKAFSRVRHGGAVLGLVREGRARRQQCAGQVRLGASMWVPLIR